MALGSGNDMTGRYKVIKNQSRFLCVLHESCAVCLHPVCDVVVQSK